MADSEQVDILRAEWTAMFERVLKLGFDMGSERALTTLMVAARAQIGGSSVQPPISSADRHLNLNRSRHIPGTRRSLHSKRAPAGSVMKTVEDVLSRSLVPLRVHDVIRESEKFDGNTLKDTSVRMALSSLREKGLVEQNDIGEWTLARRDNRSDAEMPSADNVMHKAA